jgi:uncharacterized protein
MPELELKKRPKNPIIIEGFPGFGLVGTITTEFLIEHLKTEHIGRIILEDSSAMVAIHDNKLIEPMGLFYNEKYNIVILHSINSVPGTEWKIADMIKQLAGDLGAKEIICIEGVGSSADTDDSRVFYYTNNDEKDKAFKNMKIEPLQEGIIMGVTSALLLKMENFPISCVFAESHSNLPDSKAAAEIIKVLDKYLNLEVDPKPLLDTAQKFEEKLKGIINSTSKASRMKDEKTLSYFG